MLCAMMLHHFFPSVPAIGYWASCAIAVVLWVIGGFFKSASTTK
jgi:hypothetical protein